MSSIRSVAARLGKYFLIRVASNPALVLEAEDGVDRPGVTVLLGEVVATVTAPLCHQLWYVDGGTTTIRNKLNQFCLDLTDDGRFVINPYVPKRSSQSWLVEGERIHYATDPDRVLGALEQPVVSGRRVGAIAASQDLPGQLWTIEYQPPLYFYIKLYDNMSQVLDIRGRDPKAGSKVIVYPNKGDLADNQLWYEDQTGVIRSKLNGYALDASGSSLMMLPLDPSNKRQQWVVNGSWIENRFNAREVLQHKPSSILSPATAVPVIQEPNSPNAAALWRFEFIPDQVDSLNHTGRGKHFMLRSRASGLVVEVKGKVIEPGCKVTTSSPSKDQSLLARQQFYADDVTGTLRSALRNYCIDATAEGEVVLNPYDPYRKTQQWRICGKKIQNRHSLDQVLELGSRPGSVSGDSLGGEGGSMDEGVNCGEEVGASLRVAGAYTGDERQHWELVHTPAKCFYIVSQSTEKVLDVRGDEASAGSTVILYDRKGVVSTNQLWYEDEHGLLRSKLNGYVLDASTNPVKMRPHDPTNRDHEWIIIGDRIQNRYDQQRVLDIRSGGTRGGATLVAYKYHGGLNQRWKFEEVRL